MSEVIEESYREIFEVVKNELRHRNLDAIIKSGFVLSGGGSEINSIQELVRDYFSTVVLYFSNLDAVKYHASK